MGRLIDENSVIENAEKCTFTDKDDRRRFLDFVKYCVKEAPTAYNVDKVVAELEDLQCVNPFLTTTEYEHKAIEIARKGGVE